MAGADRFTLTVAGRSAHAARPDEGVDAIVLAAHVAVAVQSAVARRLAPHDQGVLHIGTVTGGVAENVLADRVEMRGTLRYFEGPVRHRLQEALRAAAAVADAMGGHAGIDLVPGYPPVVNDAAMAALVRAAAQDTLGNDAVGDFEPWMGAEDFAFLARMAPGCFFWIGAALDPPREHHHPAFDIDERVIARGAAVMAACALHALKEMA
jgi:amidohydrolase